MSHYCKLFFIYQLSVIVLCEFTNGQTFGQVPVCTPNLKYFYGDRICICDQNGQWVSSDCDKQHRLNTELQCIPGHVTWQECNQCVCQENRRMICTNFNCEAEENSEIRRHVGPMGFWCEPFRSYHVDCKVCLCPSSGKTSEAICAIDVNCSPRTNLQKSNSGMTALSSKACIPNVLYMFPCLHCHCSDKGFYNLHNCIDTCSKSKRQNVKERCIPRTFYRKDCNVCLCPDDSFPDCKLCTNVTCNDKYEFSYLHQITAKKVACTPFSFTKPRCIYCECSPGGAINIYRCFELNCMKSFEIHYANLKTACSPGEMVPLCMECYCLGNETINTKYCTRTCSDENRINILNTVLKNSLEDSSLINIQNTSFNNGKCIARSVFRRTHKICLCPDSGVFNDYLCALIRRDINATFRSTTTSTSSTHSTTLIDFNTTCRPFTYIDFDCNSCLCSKSGSIDPKWCTNDDCEAKRKVEVSNAALTNLEAESACTPGMIYKIRCNYCICPKDGNSNHICTNNTCLENYLNDNNKFICIPMSYYDVDCNTCRCPPDGRKNIEKCTKRVCEKSYYLRSDNCEPGDLFSDGCNVCICPPSGVKSERICFERSCGETSKTLRTLKVSDDLENALSLGVERRIDVCFPGEEYTDGCNICVCTELGLRSYSKCSADINCKEQESRSADQEANPSDASSNRGRFRRENEDNHRCHRKNYDAKDDTSAVYVDNCTPPRKPCNPGVMYVVRCQECICPFYGEVTDYCRNANMKYCDQPYPGGYWEVEARRTQHNDTFSSDLSTDINLNFQNSTKARTETKYTCERPGNFVDRCHLCQCVDGVMVLEECFMKQIPECSSKNITFLRGREPFAVDTYNFTTVTKPSKNYNS